MIARFSMSFSDRENERNEDRIASEVRHKFTSNIQGHVGVVASEHKSHRGLQWLVRSKLPNLTQTNLQERIS